jgi:endonuclease V-like protein UPF0215 family
MNLLYDKTSIPVVTILSEIPNENEVKKALVNLSDWEQRLKILNNNPPIINLKFTNKDGRECDALIQQIGLPNNTSIKKLLRLSCFSSCVPEGLRLADKIGQSFKDFTI